MKTNRKVWVPILVISLAVLLTAGAVSAVIFIPKMIVRAAGNAAEDFVEEVSDEIEEVTEVEEVQVDYFELLNTAFSEQEDILITETFTGTETYEGGSQLTVLDDVKVPFTKNSYNVTYDINIDAAIHFSRIRIINIYDKDIYVSLPEAFVYRKSVDQDSVVVSDQKNNIINQIDLQHVNDEISERLDADVETAVSQGLLERADRNAKTEIEAFIKAVCGEDVNVYFVS